MEYSNESDNRRVIGVVTEENPKNTSQKVFPPMMGFSQRPMILQMPFMQQLQMGNQYPFPLMVFFFPRIALFFMTQQNMLGQRKIGIQRITQLLRDEKGRIIEITEITQ